MCVEVARWRRSRQADAESESKPFYSMYVCHVMSSCWRHCIYVVDMRRYPRSPIRLKQRPNDSTNGPTGNGHWPHCLIVLSPPPFPSLTACGRWWQCLLSLQWTVTPSVVFRHWKTTGPVAVAEVSGLQRRRRRYRCSSSYPDPITPHRGVRTRNNRRRSTILLLPYYVTSRGHR